MARLAKETPLWIRNYPYLLTVGGALGLFASLMLSLEKIKVLQDPAFQPACNINPILSCTSVMNSTHNSTASIPNPYIGLAAFAVIITTGMAMLAGATFKKWFWLGLQLGTLGGVAFVHWLYVQSVYGLGKLCLYCMLIWIIVIPIFWYTTLINVHKRFLPVHARAAQLMNFLQRHHFDVVVVWYLAIAISIVARFWYYFGP